MITCTNVGKLYPIPHPMVLVHKIVILPAVQPMLATAVLDVTHEK